MIVRELFMMSFGCYDVFSMSCVLFWLVFDILANYGCVYLGYDDYVVIFSFPYATLGVLSIGRLYDELGV